MKRYYCRSDNGYHWYHHGKHKEGLGGGRCGAEVYTIRDQVSTRGICGNRGAGINGGSGMRVSCSPWTPDHVYQVLAVELEPQL